VAKISRLVDTDGATTMLIRSGRGRSAASSPASVRAGKSRNSTRPSISVVSSSFTATHQCFSRPHGVQIAFTTPTSQTSTLSGVNSTRPIRLCAG
jgi:hypothetical protein